MAFPESAHPDRPPVGGAHRADAGPATRPGPSSDPVRPDPRSAATEFLEGGSTILAALAAVAAAGRTGTAWLMGHTAGALHFRNGRVVGAELAGSPWCRALLVASGRLMPEEWEEFASAWAEPAAQPRPGAPPARGMGVLEWVAVSLGATVEAATELLPQEVVGPGDRPDIVADMVFQSDGIPGWTGSVRPAQFPWLRREIGRRHALLDRLRTVLGPDSVVTRAPGERLAPVQVSAQQWRVLAALSEGGGTARSVGRRLGIGTFAATLVLHTLMRLGMVTATVAGNESRRSPSASSRTMFMDAADAAG